MHWFFFFSRLVSKLCPVTHRWAIEDGDICCKHYFRASNNHEDIQFEDKVNECVNGTAIPCPTVDPKVKCVSDKLSMRRTQNFELKLAMTIEWFFLFLVNGKWTPWSQVGQCSGECGERVTPFERSCTNPSPRFGGAQCPGNSTQEISCNTNVANPIATPGSCAQSAKGKENP